MPCTCHLMEGGCCGECRVGLDAEQIRRAERANTDRGPDLRPTRREAEADEALETEEADAD